MRLFLAFERGTGLKTSMPASFPSHTQNRKAKLLDQVRQAVRFKHYSIRTEQAYVDWIKKFIIFHKKRHPATMGADEVRDFLNHLANRVSVAASTQNQAFSALLFLYREVLRQELPWIDNVDRVKRPAKLPVVLTQDEVRALLSKMSGTVGLMAQLLYGCGLRLMECVQLRIKDIDFGYRQITIRDAKGGRDRRTILPESLIDSLRRHIEKRRLLHEEDLAAGHGAVPLPGALARKYPNAPRDFGWQYVFPSRLHTGRCSNTAITLPRRSSSALSKWRFERRASANRRHVTRYGIHSPHICSKTAMTFGLCRNYSATPVCRPRSAIRSCWRWKIRPTT